MSQVMIFIDNIPGFCNVQFDKSEPELLQRHTEFPLACADWERRCPFVEGTTNEGNLYYNLNEDTVDLFLVPSNQFYHHP
jgi:hypothetical protein